MPASRRASFQRKIARLLDRPGGRALLGKIATRYSARFPGGSAEIKYSDGFWMHRSGSYTFVDEPEFDYTRGQLERLGSWAELFPAGTKEYWFRRYEPREGDVVVDVGAGCGEDTFTFSKAVGATGRVIAIEAHPVNYAILKKFCEINGLANVVPLHVAAIDKTGTVRISDEDSKWMSHSIQDDDMATEGIEVPADTLDRICSRLALEEIALLKMNIEGAERRALLGMSAAVGRVRNIGVACHDFKAEKGEGECFRTREFVEVFLKEHGFEIERRADDPRDYVRDHVIGRRK